MKTTEYYKIIFPKGFTGRIAGIRKYIEAALEKKYNFAGDPYTKQDVSTAMAGGLTYVLVALSEGVEGKTILDLGCGSTDPKIEHGNREITRQYEPWISRALHILGANVIGLDYGPLDGEQFTHYQVDLRNPDSLSFLPDQSVDLANARLLFSSCMMRGTPGASQAMQENLMPQLERILKPEGTFIYVG